jgi:hypothetical protein
VTPSTRDCKHGRDATDSLELRNILRRAPQLANTVVSSREDASLRVNENHSFVEGSQASKRSLRTVFHLDEGRLESFVGVAESQLPFGVVSQHPEAFFGLCHEEVVTTSYFDERRESFHSLRERGCPGEGLAIDRPHPKAAFGIDCCAIAPYTYRSDTW